MGKVFNTWSNADMFWMNANLVSSPNSASNNTQTCYKWGNADVLWLNANWLWSQCSGSVIPPTPPTTSFVIPTGIDASTLIQPWLIQPWNPYRAADGEQDKKKRFIKLICRINGETFEEEKEIEKHEVSVDDIRMVVRSVSDIDLDIKNYGEIT